MKDTLYHSLQVNLGTLKQQKWPLNIPQQQLSRVLLNSVLTRATCAGSLSGVYTITPSSEIPRLNPFSVNGIQMLS